jgi:homoserine O-acetyltransferase
LVLGISTDRLFPIEQQHQLAEHLPNALDGRTALALDSPYGHDGFLIEAEPVGEAIARLLATAG